MSRNLRKYQIVMLGPDTTSHRERIISALERRVNDLGDGIWEYIDVLEDAHAADFDNTAPVFAIWFGSPDQINAAHLVTLNSLLANAKPTLPVVRDMADFTAQTPPQLRSVNGLLLDKTLGTLERVINTIIEGLQLLRKRRRLFISYARKDSRTAAKQLFGSLAEHGFDVFLDTHGHVPLLPIFKTNCGTPWSIPTLWCYWTLTVWKTVVGAVRNTSEPTRYQLVSYVFCGPIG